MTGLPRTTHRRQRVAVLVAHWESKTEEGWITRQIAGALACIADVHVITPDGRTTGEQTDGVYTVHPLLTPVDTGAEARRDLLLEAIAQTSSSVELTMSTDVAELLDRDLIEPWGDAAPILGDLEPDLIVIAGHKCLGALAAVDQSVCRAPLALAALGTDTFSLASSHFASLFNRADVILTVTEGEGESVIEFHGGAEKVHLIGAPLAANPSARTEPNTWVGETDYILVVTESGSDEAHIDTDLGRLIRLRFPDNPVGISHRDSFCAWHNGRLKQGWAVERSSDMARLIAWARVLVDLRPGRLFARRCLDSLLYGTPIVVPANSRAREHAERGRGGLWFTNPAELTWCVEAMLDPDTRDAFGHQGRVYAEEEYGSTDKFIDRVTKACGLPPPAHVQPTT